MDALRWYADFASGHWFLAFCIWFTVHQVVVMPFRVYNRFIRHMNIRRAGWPPPHLDVDGDAPTFRDKARTAARA